MGRSSRQQADRNRERVVETACRLFRQHGVENVSIADIMSAAGLTAGGFYKHFASKESLIDEAFALAFEQSSGAWQQLQAREKTPKNLELETLVRHYFARRPPEKSCPLLALASLPSHAPLCGHSAERYSDGAEALLRLFLETSGAAQEGSASPPSEDEAHVLFAAMGGAGLMARAAGDTPWVQSLQTAVIKHAQRLKQDDDNR